MNTKLTLTLDKAIIEKAKKHAKKEGRSLSEIVERYLEKVTQSQEAEHKITPTVKSMRGAFKLPDSFDYKKALAKGLSEKYGK